jgi:uncharacterized protein
MGWGEQLHCPACRTPLIVVEREGIEVDCCPTCRGIWFDEGELELLGESAGVTMSPSSLFAAGGRPGRRRCPRCSVRMELLDAAELQGRSVEVDRCPEHGLWLDRGELGRILRGQVAAQGADESVLLDFLGETFAAAGDLTGEEIH